jgi:hypothetical protein
MGQWTKVSWSIYIYESATKGHNQDSEQINAKKSREEKTFQNSNHFHFIHTQIIVILIIKNRIVHCTMYICTYSIYVCDPLQHEERTNIVFWNIFFGLWWLIYSKTRWHISPSVSSQKSCETGDWPSFFRSLCPCKDCLSNSAIKFWKGEKILENINIFVSPGILYWGPKLLFSI